MPYLEELVTKTKAEKKGVEGILGTAATEPAKPTAPTRGQVPAKEEEKVLIEKYGDVRIYRVKGEALYRYEVPTPHYRGEEKALISALIEIASKVISPEREAGKAPEQRKFAYYQKILEIIDSSPELRVPPTAKEFYAEAATREMAGWGLIDPLLQDDKLEDILLIGPNNPAYVFHRKYDMMKTNIVFYDDKDIKDLIDRIARNIGRHIDIQSPLLDARLPDGTRVNATVPPASVNGSTLSIRKFRLDPITIIDMVNFGTLNYEVGAFLWLATDGFGAKPANIVIAGGTASGKTTTLNVLSSFIPNNERIITIEDTAELNLPLEHWVRFETRPPGLEGVGEITMDMLVKNSLRMRPDRIIVGEIRGEEGHTLFNAMNTGHDGVELATEPVYLASGEIKEAEALFSEHYSPDAVVKEGNFEYISLSNGPSVCALDKQTLKLVHKPILRVWRRPKKEGEKAFQIITSGKREITLSHDHPAYRINAEGLLEQVHASELREGDRIATPKTIETVSKTVSAVSEANENTNVDLIPAAALISKTRNALSLTQKELSVSAGFGKTRTVIRSYECGQRTPSSAALKQISAALVEKFNERTQQLKQGFDEIDRIADEWLQNPGKAAGKTIALLKRMRVNTSLFEERSRIGRAYLYHYANGTLRPTRKQTRAVCAALSELIMQINFELSDCKKIILHLQALANSDVVFEKIVSLKESAPTPFLYDLTVEDCHTYLSGTNGGIFISNCMGTLHSNSARETLIRLANPPISIPLIMLQSLNFIVMQQRINDRRKGLIRRITEIAEVVSVEENQMPKLQTLYQWDPAKDVIYNTGMNSLYTQTLSKYTGFSRETLLQELQTRAKILQELNNRNIRGLKEVCSVTQSYILRTRGKI